jgi:hypothetical protein
MGPFIKRPPQPPVVDTFIGNDKASPGSIPTPCSRRYKPFEQYRIIFIKRNHYPAIPAKKIYHFHNRPPMKNEVPPNKMREPRLYHNKEIKKKKVEKSALRHYI